MYSPFYPITISGVYFVFLSLSLSLSLSLFLSFVPHCLPTPTLHCVAPVFHFLPPVLLLPALSRPLFPSTLYAPSFSMSSIEGLPSPRREEGGRGAGYFLVVGYFWFSHNVNKIKKNRNHHFFWDFSVVSYKNSWRLIFWQIFPFDGVFCLVIKQGWIS